MNLLGVELETAKERLAQAGAADIRVTLTSSRKGVPDADACRVVRAREKAGAWELVAANCRTTLPEDDG